jgi:hypothetical protein
VTAEQHDEALPDWVLEKLRQVSTSTLAAGRGPLGYRTMATQFTATTEEV